MSKYNPTNISDLSKGKMRQKVGYKKGTFCTEPEKLVEIMTNGGQVEIKSQESRLLDGIRVQMIECKIYFITIP